LSFIDRTGLLDNLQSDHVKSFGPWWDVFERDTCTLRGLACKGHNAFLAHALWSVDMIHQQWLLAKPWLWPVFCPCGGERFFSGPKRAWFGSHLQEHLRDSQPHTCPINECSEQRMGHTEFIRHMVNRRSTYLNPTRQRLFLKCQERTTDDPISRAVSG
jgi:hypothetical protein